MSKYQFKAGTFILVPNKHLLSKMSNRAALTWVSLCSYADEDGNCYPSYKTLASFVGVGEMTIKRGITELIEKGVVKKVSRKKEDGSYTSNYYTLYLSD